MNQANVLDLAQQAGILPWVKHEWTGKQFIHTDEGMDGDFASLVQFYELIVGQERERAAMICHQYKDWSDNPAEAIATAILRSE